VKDIFHDAYLCPIICCFEIPNKQNNIRTCHVTRLTYHDLIDLMSVTEFL